MASGGQSTEDEALPPAVNVTIIVGAKGLLQTGRFGGRRQTFDGSTAVLVA
jgi:hypothetical protein